MQDLHYFLTDTRWYKAIFRCFSIDKYFQWPCFSSSLCTQPAPQTKLNSVKQRPNPFSGPPPVYQDLSTRHDWPVKKAYVDLPISNIQQLLFLEPEWALSQQPIRPYSEAIRARGIIVFIKSNQLVKNIQTKQLQLAKSDSAIIVLVFKADTFRYQWAIEYSLVVAQPITTQH